MSATILAGFESWWCRPWESGGRDRFRGRSSLGRASRWQREGKGFESPRLHFFLCQLSRMSKRALRVAARWAFQLAQGDRQAEISPEIIRWVEARNFTARHDYVKDLDRLDLVKDNTFSPIMTLEEEAFGDAKLSIEIMLPKVLQTLAKKFRDKFYMRATQQRLKLYYYFSGHPALETIALTLTMKGGKPLVWLGHIPMKISGGADFAKAINEQARVQDPEMAGLACMRVLRGLLGRIA